jgi:hypothetical protein
MKRKHRARSHQHSEYSGTLRNLRRRSELFRADARKPERVKISAKRIMQNNFQIHTTELASSNSTRHNALSIRGSKFWQENWERIPKLLLHRVLVHCHPQIRRIATSVRANHIRAKGAWRSYDRGGCSFAFPPEKQSRWQGYFDRGS